MTRSVWAVHGPEARGFVMGESADSVLPGPLLSRRRFVGLAAFTAAVVVLSPAPTSAQGPSPAGPGGGSEEPFIRRSCTPSETIPQSQQGRVLYHFDPAKLTPEDAQAGNEEAAMVSLTVTYSPQEYPESASAESDDPTEESGAEQPSEGE